MSTKFIATGSARTTRASLGRRRFRLGEFLIEKGISVVSLLSMAFIILIFVFVFREASPILWGGAKIPAGQAASNEMEEMETYGDDPGADVSAGRSGVLELVTTDDHASIASLTSSTWQPVSLQPKYGLWPLVVGTLKVALIAVLLAAPIAILAALYSSMFAPKRAKEFIKPFIEILAGFPSVVIGFFALVVLASLLQTLFGFQYRLNAITGGIALSLAVIPIIYTISEDALNAVPKSLTEASLALGARKWETALLVVLPAATPGVFAAVLLGIGRAVGETMIALMATGNSALMSWNPAEPVRTIAATIGAEMAEVVFGDVHYSVLFLIGVLLFAFSFVFNVIAEFYVRQRLMKRFRGA